jgi:hypothetical protein
VRPCSVWSVTRSRACLTPPPEYLLGLLQRRNDPTGLVISSHRRPLSRCRMTLCIKAVAARALTSLTHAHSHLLSCPRPATAP